MPIYVFTAHIDWQDVTLLNGSSLAEPVVTGTILKSDPCGTGAPAIISINIVRGIRIEIRNPVIATVDAPI